MKRKKVRRAGAVLGSIAAVVALALAAGFVTTPDASATQYADTFESKLAAPVVGEKIAAEPADLSAATHARSATVIRVAAPRPTATRVSTGGSTQAPTATRTASAPSSLATAQAILNRYIAKYPILKGSTVTFGDAKGYQAICYYKSGRIIISPTHTRSLETIIAHEVGHILDWRDNGVIDWGENIPPL
ncbi:MAG: hypothetical protein ISP10_01965 [Aeromicrobium sp.]|nr:hypothetical protein [Aeromicrobium sp.]